MAWSITTLRLISWDTAKVALVRLIFIGVLGRNRLIIFVASFKEHCAFGRSHYIVVLFRLVSRYKILDFNNAGSMQSKATRDHLLFQACHAAMAPWAEIILALKLGPWHNTVSTDSFELWVVVQWLVFGSLMVGWVLKRRCQFRTCAFLARDYYFGSGSPIFFGIVLRVRLECVVSGRFKLLTNLLQSPLNLLIFLQLFQSFFTLCRQLLVHAKVWFDGLEAVELLALQIDWGLLALRDCRSLLSCDVLPHRLGHTRRLLLANALHQVLSVYT